MQDDRRQGARAGNKWMSLVLPGIGILALVALAEEPSSVPAIEAEGLDRLIELGWEKAGLSPAAPADDATFLRRLSLDLRGCIPSAEEAAAFIEDAFPRKRERKIEEVLDSDEFARHFGGLWAEALTGKPLADRSEGLAGFREYTIAAVREDRPFDVLARDVIGANGWIDENPAVYFIRRWDAQASDLTATVARAFMGLQLRCAQCHDHPTDRFKREDFWGMAAFLARPYVSYDEGEAKFTDVDGGEYLRYRVDEAQEGEVDALPAGHRPLVAPPRFLGAQGPALTGPQRRARFAEWLTSSDNRWFARAIVNRTWAHLLGRGLVHPFENMSDKHAPSHPELLDGLTRAFVADGFRLKALVRRIVSSRAYQLDSRFEGERPKDQSFAVALRRRLTNAQLYASYASATGIEFDLRETVEIDAPSEEEREAMLDAAGMAEVQVTFPPCVYLQEFGILSPVETVLLGFNSTLVSHGLLTGSAVQSVLQEETSTEDRVGWLFLSALSRWPTPEEQEFFAGQAEAAPDDPATYRRILWTLLNSTEFAHRR